MIRLLLLLYPERFRRDFADEIVALFAELQGWSHARSLVEFAAVGLAQRGQLSVRPAIATLCALVLHAGLYSTLVPIAKAAESAGQTLTLLEKRYATAMKRFERGKSIDDLDRLSQWMDTPDWRSVVNGREQTWQDLRKYGFKGLWTPNRIPWRIQQFRLLETGAEVELRVGGIRVVDTWRRTPNGWRRSRHEKFP